MDPRGSVMFFLGAGFSSALNMPETKELRLIFQRRFPTELEEPFSIVKHTLDKMHGVGEYDIEKVCTFVNDLLWLSEGKMPVELTSDPEHLYLLGKIVKRDEELRATLVKVQEYIMRLIEEEFWQRRLYEMEKVGQIIQNHILESLPPTHISIYTTNYDLVIEEFFREFHSEMKLNRGIVDGVYRPETFDDRPADAITFCKLHGSIDLYETEDGSIIHHPGPASTYEGSAKLKRMHLVAPIENRREYEKMEESLRKRLYMDFLFSSLIVVVGFSFRDPLIRDQFLTPRSGGSVRLVACGERTKSVLRSAYFDRDQDPVEMFRVVPHRFPSTELETAIGGAFREVFEHPSDSA